VDHALAAARRCNTVKRAAAAMQRVAFHARARSPASRYRFLQKHGWTVEEKKVSGKFGNGKPYEGLQFVAKSGDKGLVTRVVPFGDDMVETTTLLVNKPTK
jgi:hypothetical protein